MSSLETKSLPPQEKAWHTYGIEETLRILGSDAERGLSQAELRHRQQFYGSNELHEGHRRGHWQIFLDQFSNVMLLMLIGVAIISGVMDLVQLHHGNRATMGVPFKDTIAIFAIVFLNGMLGYLQEARAEKALAALKRLASPKVQVIREYQRLEVDAASLVPGDIMLMEAGSQLCADGQLLEASNLQIRESALTGEAHPVTKIVNSEGLAENTPLGDRRSTVFTGTDVIQGRGKAVVTGIGMTTELGKIAQMLQDVKNEPTPLQRRMTDLGNILVSSSLILVTLVVGLGVLKNSWGMLQNLVEISLSMAVAVVPEGLPAVITVTLALGTQRMVKRHALIRKLPAVETLGSVNVICSDKTGTLTQNKMVVQEVKSLEVNIVVTGDGYDPTGEFQTPQGQPLTPHSRPDLQLLCLACTLCNDAHLGQNGGEWEIMGDPTEGALLALAGKAGFRQDDLQSDWPRRGEFPFSSERKRMSVVLEIPDSAESKCLATQFSTVQYPLILFCKGSPELVLERCEAVCTGQGLDPVTASLCQQILADNDSMAGRGLRVLGLAYRPLATVPSGENEAEQKLVWLGLIGMLDAPRTEVKLAIDKCRAAGIRTLMITGDHPLTASVIARSLNIIHDGDEILTGQALDELSQDDFEAMVDQIGVFARVSPEHKLRIVKALQKRNNFVAMTGDGVNDAPALKQADIGIAMGITGTDVSKEASDMVLLDDNFATIVAATEEGRVVYSNIRHFIKYILGSNIGEVITIAAAPILGLSGVPLTPLQILWMNLVTDGLPALALAVEPGEPDIMRRQPFSPKESIFARGLGSYIIRIGLVFATVTISLMVWAYHSAVDSGSPDSWKTMVFTTLCIAQMGHAIAVRSNTKLTIEMDPRSNLSLWGAVILTTILQFMLIYVEPLRNFFETDLLTPRQLIICLGFSSLMFVWVEMEKIVARIYHHYVSPSQETLV